MVNSSLSLLIIEPQLASTRMNYVMCDSSSLSLHAPVMTWPFYTRLDSIGIAGFSYDFGSLKAKTSSIVAAVDSLGSIKPSFSIMLSFVLGMILPSLSTKIPNKLMQTMRSLGRGIREIADELLDKATKEKAEICAGEVEKSIIGALGEKCLFLVKELYAEDGGQYIVSQICQCELKKSHVDRRSHVASEWSYSYIFWVSPLTECRTPLDGEEFSDATMIKSIDEML